MENQDQAKLLNTNKTPEHHQTIITLIEDHLELDKKNFIGKLSVQEKKQEEIEKIAKELKVDINNLEQTIQNILDKHHKDYISTFSTFMDTVRNDLKLKLEQMEKIEEEKRKINDVNIIRCERDYFRAESIKLNNFNKELNVKIEDMGLRMKILSDEVNNLTIKWKDSESLNRQLLVELEMNIQSHKQLEQEAYQLKEVIQSLHQTPPLSSMQPKGDDLSREHLVMLIDKLKLENKKEKTLSSKIQNELNNILLEKNKLENIFIDCVEETRKNIFNRRLKGNINARVRKVEDKSSIVVNSKYDSFLPADKKEILEHFVFNDEVNNIIREAIFTKPKSQIRHSATHREKLHKLEINNNHQGDKENMSNISKDGKMGQTTNIIDNTRTTFFKTGRLTMTSFHHPSGNKGLSLPVQINK